MLDNNTIIKKEGLYLKFIVLGLSFLLLTLFFYAFFQGKYYVAEEDETIYYSAARLFSETGSVRATSCINENVAKIWGCNWYGPMYPIFYGTLAKIIGFRAYNFLIINILCLLLIILLIYKANFTQNCKLAIIASILSAEAFVVYVFRFYPEPLNALFGTILTLQLRSIYYKYIAKENIFRSILVFSLLLFFFSLFRVTFIFWMFGLLAFTRSRKNFIQILILAIASLVSITFYIKYFNAPAYGSNFSHIMRGKLDMISFIATIKVCCKNAYFYFTRNSFFDLLNFLVLMSVVFTYYITKDKFVLAASIIGLLYFSVLLSLYVYYSYFFNKQIASIYPLFFVAIYSAINTEYIKKAVIALLFIFSPISYLKAYGQVRDHRKFYIQNEQLGSTKDSLNAIKYKIADRKPVTILSLYREFDDKMPLQLFITNLPVSTVYKSPITFTLNFESGTYTGNIKEYSSRFITYGRLRVDYFLTKHPVSIDSTSLIYSNNLYYLYKNNKKP